MSCATLAFPVESLLKQAEAAKSFIKLIDAAIECRRLYQDAGMKLPEPLVRLLGEAVTDEPPSGHHARMVVPPPPRPPAPPEADEKWLWVENGSVLATNLVLATLRRADGPMQASAIIEAIHRIDPTVSKGTISNIGTRLDGKLFARSPDGWALLPGIDTPIIHGDYTWGPYSVFEPHEIAAYRRAGLVHVLRTHSDGLQVVQLVKVWNENCPWKNVPPVTKDLIKVDLQVLSDDKIVRKMGGHSGKWTAA